MQAKQQKNRLLSCKCRISPVYFMHGLEGGCQIRTRDSRTFHRFFWTYLAFALTLLLLLIPVFLYVNSILYDMELERSVNRLNEGIAALDATADNLINAVSTTSQDMRFRRLSYASAGESIDTTLLPGLQTGFRGLVTPQNLVSDAGILFGGDVIITRQRAFFSSTYYSFYGDFFSAQGQSFAQWRALLEANHDRFLPEMAYWSHDFGAYEGLTYAAPWPTGAQTTQSMFYATLKSDAVLRALVDEDVLVDAYVRVVDANDRVLLAHGSAESGQYHAIASTTSRNRLRIEVGVPTYILNARLQPVYRLMLLYGVLMVMVAAIMIVFFAYRSATPIRKLLEMISFSKYARTEEPETSTGIRQRLNFQQDYQRLAKGISTMHDDLAENQRTMEAQKQLLAAHLWEKALLRGLYSLEDLTQFAQMHPDFPERFRLAVFRYAFDEQPDANQVASLQVRMLEAVRARVADAYAQGMENDMLILVFPVNPERDALDCHTALLSLHGDLTAQFALPSLLCYVSDVYQRVSDLPRAYEQALSLEGFALDAEDTPVIGLLSMPRQRVHLPIGVPEIQTMYSALSAGNLQVALAVLEDCRENLFAEEENTMFCKHAYTLISQTLVQLKLEHPATLFAIVLPSYRNANREGLFAEEMPACFHEICDAIWASRTDNGEAQAQRVIGFAEEHLYDPDLSVTMAADHFNISGRTLQKLIKDATGQTFAAYVEEKRLMRAYHLLADLSLSVNETAEQCGFASTNSFYKAFKRKYDVSPGQVAKMPRQNGA